MKKSIYEKACIVLNPFPSILSLFARFDWVRVWGALIHLFIHRESVVNGGRKYSIQMNVYIFGNQMNVSFVIMIRMMNFSVYLYLPIHTSERNWLFCTNHVLNKSTAKEYVLFSRQSILFIPFFLLQNFAKSRWYKRMKGLWFKCLFNILRFSLSLFTPLHFTSLHLTFVLLLQFDANGTWTEDANEDITESDYGSKY